MESLRCSLCQLCFVGRDDHIFWLNQVRFLFEGHWISDEIFLSGKGIIREDYIFVPRDSEASWSAGDYEGVLDLQQWMPDLNNATNGYREWMMQRMGFAVHEACWRAFEEWAGPVSQQLLGHLYRILASRGRMMVIMAPSQTATVEYILLPSRPITTRFLMEDIDVYYPEHVTFRHAQRKWHAKHPVFGVQLILDQFMEQGIVSDDTLTLAALAAQTDPTSAIVAVSIPASRGSTSLSTNTPNSPIALTTGERPLVPRHLVEKGFPLDVWFHISDHLQLTDALSLASSNTSLHAICERQALYRASFFGPGPLGHLQVHGPSNSQNDVVLDWKAATKAAFLVKDSPSAKVRERLQAFWFELKPSIAWNLSWSGITLPRNPTFDDDTRVPGTPETVVATRLHTWESHELSSSRELGSFTLARRLIHISPEVDQVVVYFVRWEGVAYICGLCFFSRSGEASMLGNSSPIVETANINGFFGLSVALDIRGLRAVKPQGSNRPWLGSPEGCLRTDRLVASNRLSVLTACFDSFKMVSLSTTSNSLPVYDLNNLRRWSLWDHGTPPTIAKLGANRMTTNVMEEDWREPWTWACFGGRDGRKLRCLSSVTIRSSDIYHPIHFEYSNDSMETVSLGMEKDAVWNVGAATSVSIDGAAGERIVGIRVKIIHQREGDWCLKAVTSLQFITNWGQRPVLFDYNFPEGVDYRGVMTLRSSSGTFVTGLFASQPYEKWGFFSSIGLMESPEVDLCED